MVSFCVVFVKFHWFNYIKTLNLKDVCLRLFEANFPRGTTNQKHYPASEWNFCARPSAVISQPRPVVASRKIGCFLRLKIHYIQTKVIKSFRRMDRLDRNKITASGSIRPVSFDGFTLNLIFFFLLTVLAEKNHLIGALIAIPYPFWPLRLKWGNCSLTLWLKKVIQAGIT